jgi:hypothetical protein
MDKCVGQSISISVDVGECRAEFGRFCRELVAASFSPAVLSRQIDRLRGRACAYQDRPTRDHLKLMLVCNILLDLVLHGWSINVKRSVVTLTPRNESGEARDLQKERVRQRHLVERNAQLREPSVHEFISGMERRRLTNKGWHSIYSVMRDGSELASSLRGAASELDLSERTQRLETAIDPYLQFVDAKAHCSETGLRLGDIWRYFRHTWVNTYKSVPGRNVMILVRDRARPNHPVIGIAALASSVVQQSVRDKWIGWDSETAIATLSTDPSPKNIRSLIQQLQSLVRAIYSKDLIRQRVIVKRDLKHPRAEVVNRLREEAQRAIKLHRKNPGAAALKSSAGRTNKEWVAIAETNLFRSKRCTQLAALLAAQSIMQEKQIARLSRAELKKALEEASVKQALRCIVRFGKAKRVGISMMDIAVCGAVAPYNAILGGKLICLLLCSPEIVQHYANRYSDHVSIIASGMKGRRVRRDPKLVLLCTTSLYGNGSSQYNRIRVPADRVGGHRSDHVRYEELGTSEGFGSFHFSKETVRLSDALLGRSKNGRKVNSIFGEGVNPLMRKVREALDSVGLPSDALLNHGNKRIVYGIPLARNFRSILAGGAERARYIVPQSSPKRRTRLLVKYWIDRWLSKRIENETVLEQVASHILSYPIHHDARVRLSEDQDTETAYVMSTALRSGPMINYGAKHIRGKLRGVSA